MFYNVKEEPTWCQLRSPLSKVRSTNASPPCRQGHGMSCIWTCPAPLHSVALDQSLPYLVSVGSSYYGCLYSELSSTYGCHLRQLPTSAVTPQTPRKMTSLASVQLEPIFHTLVCICFLPVTQGFLLRPPWALLTWDDPSVSAVYLCNPAQFSSSPHWRFSAVAPQ